MTFYLIEDEMSFVFGFIFNLSEYLILSTFSNKILDNPHKKKKKKTHDFYRSKQKFLN